MVVVMDYSDPIAYKFVGQYYSWIVDEVNSEHDLDECQPMHAPIEDEI